MNLILWRHAEAEDIAPDRTDAGRRLTAHGLKQARQMARWLSPRLSKDTRILVSPAVRTRQTAEALERDFSTEPRLFTTADAGDHLQAIHEQNAGTLLLVGHQPTLGQLAALLMCGQPLSWSVKKGAIWWLTDINPPHAARLVCMLDTKHL